MKDASKDRMGTHTTIKGRKKVTSEEARASCKSRTIVGKSCCFCENQGGTEVRQHVLEGQHLSLAITCSSQGTLLQARVLQWGHIQPFPDHRILGHECTVLFRWTRFLGPAQC